MKRFVVAALLAFAGFFAAAPAQAGGITATQPYTCGRGAFLVGFGGKVGAWIDRFHPICAKWNPKTSAPDAPTNGPDFGYSNGGVVKAAPCRSGEAVKRIQFSQADPKGEPHIQNLVVHCSIIDTMEAVDADTQFMQSDSGGSTMQSVCDKNKLAYGMTVYFGNNAIPEIRLQCESPATIKQHADLHLLHTLPGTATSITGGSPSGGAASTTPVHIPPHPFPLPGTSSTPPPVPGSAMIEGDWKTSEGAMSLEQDGNRLTGSYSSDSGRIRAKRNGGAWSGVWSEAKSQERCNGEKLGTYYWGTMTFLFSNQNRHFDGVWAYCKDDPSGGAKWSGDRVK